MTSAQLGLFAPPEPTPQECKFAQRRDGYGRQKHDATECPDCQEWANGAWREEYPEGWADTVTLTIAEAYKRVGFIEGDKWQGICHVTDKLPKDYGKREAELKRRLRSAVGMLARDRSSYNDHIARQGEACSRYDIDICSFGCATRALRMSLSLISAHVTWNLAHVLILRTALGIPLDAPIPEWVEPTTTDDAPEEDAQDEGTETDGDALEDFEEGDEPEGEEE